MKTLVNKILGIEKNRVLIGVPSNPQIKHFINTDLEKGSEKQEERLIIFLDALMQTGGGAITLKIVNDDNSCEVCGIMIKSNGELNEKIIDMELKIKALKEKETTPEIESKIKTLNEKLYSLKAKRDSLESETKYYNASFNVQKIYIGKNLIGISLTMETDSPVGYGQTQTYRYTVTDQKKEFLLSDVSDEIGCIYPDLKIVIDRPGDLTISNTTFNTTTIIKNCKIDETITIKGDTQIIETDSNEHKQTLTKDFNFEFLQIGNTIKSRQNRITFSLPCKVELTYTPSIK